MLDLVQHACSAKFNGRWAVAFWLCDFALTAAILWKVPFTNIDWETYATQVDVVLGGDFDYSHVKGPTGPIAYPWGHCLFYGLLRWAQLSTFQCQVLFAALYLATIACVFQIYRLSRAPGWLLGLCVLSHRSHSVFVLRLFNDAVGAFLAYLAILLIVSQKNIGGVVVYTLSLTVKIVGLAFLPAVGLCVVLTGGWMQVLVSVSLALTLLLGPAAPFLVANPMAYLSRAFGGPGDLQHVWSVNWRLLPESLFLDRRFTAGLTLVHLGLWAWFAQCRWIPFKRGFFDARLWRWRGDHQQFDPQAAVALLFSCNFVSFVCLRTMHFQFIVWYRHMVPFLAWYGLMPDRHRGLAWVWRCAVVAFLSLAIEIAFVITERGVVRGPDGRTWETSGVPTRLGSCLLQASHMVLLMLLALRKREAVKKGD